MKKRKWKRRKDGIRQRYWYGRKPRWVGMAKLQSIQALPVKNPDYVDKVKVIIEKLEPGDLYGRVKKGDDLYQGKLVADNIIRASTVGSLQDVNKFKKKMTMMFK